MSLSFGRGSMRACATGRITLCLLQRGPASIQQMRTGPEIRDREKPHDLTSHRDLSDCNGHFGDRFDSRRLGAGLSDPGGAPDIIARLIGQRLSERLGQQFVIENKPGAGNNIATEAVINAEPDGYTLLLVNPANYINATLYTNLKFTLGRDIAPVAAFNRVPNVMTVTNDVPAKTVAEFIAYVKANPGKVNMASSGNGTSVHLSGEMFMMMTGTKMQHVPYRGARHHHEHFTGQMHRG